MVIQFFLHVFQLFDVCDGRVTLMDDQRVIEVDCERHEQNENRFNAENKIIFLSRHFEENVQLVAKMCLNCYKNETEVKIVGVNRKFIKVFDKKPENISEEIPTTSEQEKNSRPYFSKECEEIIERNEECLVLSQFFSNGQIEANLLEVSLTEKTDCENFGAKYKKKLHKNSFTLKDIKITRLKIGEQISDIPLNKSKICFGKLKTQNSLIKNEEMSRKISRIRERRKNDSKIFPVENCLVYDPMKKGTKQSQAVPEILYTPQGDLEPFWDPKNSTHNLIEENNFISINNSILIQMERNKLSQNEEKCLENFSVKNRIKKSQTAPEENQIWDASRSPQENSSYKTKKSKEKYLNATKKKVSKDKEENRVKKYSPEEIEKMSVYPPTKKRIKKSQAVPEEDEIPCTPPGALVPLWDPPKSPHCLIEEDYARNPWGILVASIFLNKTSGKQAKPYIDSFLRDHPTPEDVTKKNPNDLKIYFTELGLKKRAEILWRMSMEFTTKSWRHARELHGIGKYGDDAFRIFCIGDLDVEPTDRYLKIYHNWVKMRKKIEIED